MDSNLMGLSADAKQKLLVTNLKMVVSVQALADYTYFVGVVA